MQVGAGDASRLQTLDTEIAASEKELQSLKASSSGLQKEAESLQAKVDNAGGEKLKKKKASVSKLQEVSVGPFYYIPTLQLIVVVK